MTYDKWEGRGVNILSTFQVSTFNDLGILPFEVCTKKDQLLCQSVTHQPVCRTALASRVCQRGLNYEEQIKFKNYISALSNVSTYFVFTDVLLADPGKSRGCSTKSSVINRVSLPFPPKALWRPHGQTVKNSNPASTVTTVTVKARIKNEPTRAGARP